VDRLRLYAASVALAVPAAVFALNALISYRERGFVESWDIPAALAFGVAGAFVSRGSRIALYASVALVAIFLVTAAVGSIVPFVVYWAVALALLLQAVPMTTVARARSTT
jgi:hypothetical protein